MSTSPTTADLLACAVAAARAAGRHALANVARRGAALARSRRDVKLELDVECQARAEAVIRRAFPDHAILGEEDHTPGADAVRARQSRAEPPTSPPRPSSWRRRGAPSLEWVIDPIDGTVNFSHGVPLWCSSVAVRRGRNVLAGAVFAPAMRELYTATADGPALRNGRPIRVSDTAALDRAIVATGLDENTGAEVPPLHYFEAIARRVQRVRVLGSAALDLCFVASGRLDGYFEAGIYIWDVAAAGLLVRRAGGRADITRQEAGHRLHFLAGNPRIHRALRAAVAAD